MKTIIMAGGKGSRIASLAPDIPKPMIEINGKPVLEWEINHLREQGFTDIILTVSHLAEKIQSYFGDGSAFGTQIAYFYEERPLGNAGALFLLREQGVLKDGEDFLLLNADAIFDIDFQRFVEYHRKHKVLATLFTHPNSHPYDSGLIVADDRTHLVTAWLTKEDARPDYYKNRVNAGLHVLNTAILDTVDIDPGMIGKEDAADRTIKVDLDRQLLKPLAKTGRMIAYDSPEYVKDMGTPDRFRQVTQDFISGRVAARNLMHPQKAIFLDRDGTLNQYVGFLRDTQSLTLLPKAAKAVRLINESGYLAIIVTNQPVIARGEVTTDTLTAIHNKLETLLGNEGAYIDALYYCPHHPDKGFAGEVAELKIDCDCRKPKPGLLLQAAERFHIDLEQSWMIGDGERDVKAGKAAGCRTVYLTSGEQERFAEGGSGQADYVVDDLLEAVTLICSQYG